MPPEHDRPQCGNGRLAENDAASTQSSLQPQLIIPGAGRTVEQSATQALFYLKPALRNCFTCVGATDRQYSWREVLRLLRDYIKIKNIISETGTAVVKTDPLGAVLGVDSFEYGEVKTLFKTQVVAVENNGNTVVSILPEPPLTVASSSSSSNSASHQGPLLAWDQCIPCIPSADSDNETIYSYQGYQTASCHNTEYEESEVEEEYEEYELASDDAQEPGIPSEDNETDIENIELEVLNIDVYEYRSDSDDDAADEDSSSSDEDPDLECFRWACITCGIKNQPFVNYCEVCWKLRKDIQPEPPKKRKRRKSRSKKKQRRPDKQSDYIESDIADSVNASEFLPPPNFERSVSLDITNIPPSLSNKSKSHSQDSLPEVIDYTSSQDSGVGSQDFLSEDILYEISKEITMSNIKKNEIQIETIDDNRLDLSEPSCSNVDPEVKIISIKKDKDLSEPSCSNVDEEIKIISKKKDKSFKKRRRSSNEDSEATKRKRTEDEAKVDKVKDWPELLQTDSFKEWFMSDEGQKFVYSNKNIQDGLIMHSCSGESSIPATGLSALCSICLVRPKNGSIVHGKISHIATCYPCARRLLNTGSRCPVCRRKIHMVTKTIVT